MIWFLQKLGQPDAELTHSQRLRNAINDARTLLSFAVETNRKIDSQIVDEITGSIAALGDPTAEPFSPPPDTEKRFWNAYDGLAVAMAPVSAASIKASAAVSSSVLGTTGRHALIALILFLALVFLQGYWFIGNNLRQELKTIETDVSKKQAILDNIRLRTSRIDTEKTILEEPDDENVRKKPKLTSEQKKAREVRIAQLEDDRLKIIEESDPLRKELETLRSVRTPLVELLTRWYDKAETSDWQSENKTQLDKLTARQEELQVKRDMGQLSQRLAIRTAQTRLNDDTAKLKDAIVIDLEHRVDLLLDSMQRYLFPVFLGVLGALTFILRSLITAVRDHTYTRNLLSLSFVRVCLGMMAGLLGSWFIPSTDSALKTLPPLAIPFLFGYAVEVLFALMDRIVNAFTTPAK